MRILLVEDDEKLNKTLVFKLEKEGFDVDACHDGEEACFYGENNIYDIILLDRMLPNMEGTEVLTYLRKKKITTIPWTEPFPSAVKKVGLDTDRIFLPVWAERALAQCSNDW